MRDALEAIARDPKRRAGITSLRYGEFHLQGMNGIPLSSYLLSLLRDTDPKNTQKLAIFPQLEPDRFHYLQGILGLQPNSLITDGRASSNGDHFYVDLATYVAFEGKGKYNREGRKGSEFDLYQVQTILSEHETEEVMRGVGFLPDLEEGQVIEADARAKRWYFMWNGNLEEVVDPVDINQPKKKHGLKTG